MTTGETWWHRASEDQRMAQIIGGIECGMTSAQVAFNCGFRPIGNEGIIGLIYQAAQIRIYAARRGVRFAHHVRSKDGKRILAHHWQKMKKRSFGVIDQSAFDIFEQREKPDQMFAELEFDHEE